MITIEWKVEYGKFGKEEWVNYVEAFVTYDKELPFPDGDVVAKEAPEQYREIVKGIINNAKTAIDEGLLLPQHHIKSREYIPTSPSDLGYVDTCKAYTIMEGYISLMCTRKYNTGRVETFSTSTV